MTELPLAVTCGEPAGIGPEVIYKAWQNLRGSVPFFMIGDPRHLPANAVWTEIPGPSEAVNLSANALPVLMHAFPKTAQHGKAHAENAQCVIDVIAQAVELAIAGKVCGICTAPINKKALKDGAGFAFPGHTEFLAHKAGDVEVAMMLASEQLRVVPATIHIPLSQVAKTLTPNGLRRTIEITAQGLRESFGLSSPRIAVAGLNPHAGEQGAMGHEEQDWIADLVTDMTDEGFDLTGPHPADTMFHKQARARYDAAVCMYHDQALIPIKTLDFDAGVNVTLGLPFIRTSPDHGTAFDIAGQGVANPTSMISALRMAAKMAQRR